MATGISSQRIVGRGQELETLATALARATDGDPAIVLISGAAGVGKSRLIAEFADRAQTLGAWVLVGDCLDLVGGGLPFGPLAAILRDVVRTTPDPDRLAAILGPARDELARLVPELGSSADPSQPDAAAADASAAGASAAAGTSDVDTSHAQARLFEHLLAILGRLGQAAPTVIVLEDVHWIDPATRDLVSFLARNLRSERVLFVLSSRSEHLPRSHPHAAWLAELSRSPRTRMLTLEAFTPDETEAQLLAILGTAPEPALVSQVHARSEGNPLFNEELLAAMRSGSSTLPAFLSDALLAKVQALPARSVEVLEVAAIASRSFDERLVAAVLGGAEEDYIEAVRDAVVAQVLVAGPTSYRFRHGLFAEAVNADLTPGERRSLHRRLAVAFEAHPDLAEGGPAGVAGEAADHWRAADRPTEAYRCAIQAGLAAAAMFAYAVAFERWEQALAMEDRVAATRRAEFLDSVGLDEPGLLMRTAQVAARSEDHDRALVLAEQALAGVAAATQPGRSAVLRSEYARILWGAGRFELADQQASEAAELVNAGGTVADRARVLGRYATMLLWRGRFDEGIAAAREAVDCARRTDLHAVEVEALDALGNGLWFAGAIKEAIERLGEARQAAVDSGSVEEHLFVSDSLAECLVDADRLEEAVAVAELGEQDARRFGLDRAYGAMFRGNAGLALFGLGRWAEADAITGQGMVGHGRVWGLAVRGRLLAAMGRAGEARAVMAQVESFFPEGLPELAKVECALPAAELRLVEGDPSGALATALAALDLESPHAGLRLGLAALGLQAAADIVLDSRARRDSDALAQARTAAERCLAEVATQRSILAGWDPATPSKLATADLAEAEMARLYGAAEPERWSAIADAFERVPMPYPAAYARFRQAESLLVRGGVKAAAGDLLRTADEACRRLGAVPLAELIAGLALKARVDLTATLVPVLVNESAPTRGAGAVPGTTRPHDLRLSARELQVLGLVAAGRTNGQIADELYISPKTASVHITHILDKLGAANRVEAAMIAARAGLLEPEAGAGRDPRARD